VPVQVLPGVGSAHVANRHGPPGNIGGQRQYRPPGLGEEHREALVVAHPGQVVASPVADVRGEQRHHVVVVEAARSRVEAHALQQHGALRVADDLLLHPVAARRALVGHPEGRHARLPGDPVAGVPLLLREEVAGTGNNEAEVAGAGLIDTGVVHLVHDAVAQGEPHPAGGAEGGAHPFLGA
jgi:hypothetical protein